MRVRTLVAADLVDGSLVRDFLQTIGVGVEISAKRENVAPAWYALEAARWCIARMSSEETAARETLATNVIREVEAAGAQADATPGTQYVTPEQAATLARWFDADMAAIGARVGRHFPPRRSSQRRARSLPTADRIPERVLDLLRQRLADPAVRPQDSDTLEALEALLQATR